MTSKAVRVRFAPSPTGFLHIGGVRTALYNFLYARHFGGKFLLRIEDTDLERSEQRFTDDIMESMKWLGLAWDEEPVYQTKRMDVYAKRAQELIDSGLAYRCFCTEADVEKMREKAMAEGKKPQYDRSCREKNLPADASKPFAIRLKIPFGGSVKFLDLIRGEIEVQNAEIDDYVIIRSNGAPTYNFSCVVDDVFSEITHIVRGDDHINNTPKQLHLYQYFKFPIPEFAHLPMILGADKKKLSKRHGAVSANLYRADGYLPDALLNFLARLGWSHGDQEVFSMKELVEFFGFDHVQKSSAVFNQEKLLWLNGEHIKNTDSQRLREIIAKEHASLFSAEALNMLRTDVGLALVKLVQPKVKLVKELAEQLVPLVESAKPTVDASLFVWVKKPELKTPLQEILSEQMADFSARMKSSASAKSLIETGLNAEEAGALLKASGEKRGVKLGDVSQPIRLLLTGKTVSPSVFDLLVLMPWSWVEERLHEF